MTEKLSNSKMIFLIIEDYDSVTKGTAAVLEHAYPDVQLITAKTAEDARTQLENFSLDLIVSDLSIPARAGEEALADNGIQLLRELLEKYPMGNFVVQSTHTRTLIRIKPSIDSHQGGFTVADKSLTSEAMLKKVDWALQGLVYTPPEMRPALEIKPVWLRLLSLAFQEGMQDKAIAQTMNVAERTVRHYWTQVQDALEVYPEDGKNIRIQTELRAREKGLLD